MKLFILISVLFLGSCAHIKDNVFNNKAAQEKSSQKRKIEMEQQRHREKINISRTRFIKIGDTQGHVEKIFGDPKSIINTPKGLVYHYILLYKSTPTSDGEFYKMVFTDGKLSDFYPDKDEKAAYIREIENRKQDMRYRQEQANQRRRHIGNALMNMGNSYKSQPKQQTYQIPKRKSADCVSQTDHFGVTRTKCTEN